MTAESLQVSHPAAMRVWLPCHLAEVRAAVRKVRAFLLQQRVAPAEIDACELALVEGCNNAVQYATTAGRALPVELDILVSESAVEFQVRDHTPGFTWPGRLQLPEPELERGRGLFLIQSLMDEATYLRGGQSNS